MPQRAKGPRLYQRKDTGLWVIRDTGRGDRSTGTRDRREAERALALYLSDRDKRPGGPAQPGEMTVAEALTLYGEGHAGETKDPVRIGHAIAALVRWWGERPVSAITKETCRAYVRGRRKPGKRHPDTGEVLEWLPVAEGTTRRELGTLAAALNFCMGEGQLLNPPKVHLPAKPDPKDRWLTREEAAALIWASWRNPDAKHLSRFILVSLYTGTRKTAVLRLRYMPNTSGGWIDVDQGKLYRRGQGQAETAKKQPPVRLPRQIVAHAGRWKKRGARWVVDYEGHGVASIKTAWATAVEAAGLGETGVTPHTLRHTAITWAMQAGADIWETAGFFGVSIETMMRTYAHHHPDHQQTTVRALEARGRKL
ncbi:tyrosine-type recombinase/integrase [Pararhodobacter aggregans]|uniref:Integrase n=1 Tax=Pararhodobacter aggregans TaxID=404875 RepID=A0A2T7ULS0_9RHOB|nr:site-specific integrase [Pararhodobacter aggregans]PTW99057.1 site-specific recombinase XerD [Pararhodobacter aggregans]PVE45616.1 integrase [Pararhodobacter aggregans]